MTEGYTDIESNYTIYISENAHNNEAVTDPSNNNKLIYYGNKADDTNSCLHNYLLSPISLSIILKPDDSTCSVLGLRIDNTVGKILFTCDANNTYNNRTFIIGFSKTESTVNPDIKLLIIQNRKKLYLNFIVCCLADKYPDANLSFSEYCSTFRGKYPSLYISLSNNYSTKQIDEFYTLNSSTNNISTSNWKLNTYNSCSIKGGSVQICYFNISPLFDVTTYYSGGVSNNTLSKNMHGKYNGNKHAVIDPSNYKVLLNNLILDPSTLYETKVYFSYKVVQTH